jgi:membrane-associated phospholipid phosphatase
VDELLFAKINSFARATPWLHAAVSAYAGYGIVVFAGLLLCGWWITRRSGDPAQMATAVCAGVSALVAVGLNQPLVTLVARPRPYVVHPDWLILAHRSTDPSFPSDHAVMAGAAALGLWLVSRRLGTITAGAALLMAGARVYVGAHYPSDVLAGLAFGAIIAVATYLLCRPMLTRILVAAARTRLRPLVVAPAAVAQQVR